MNVYFNCKENDFVSDIYYSFVLEGSLIEI